MSSILSLFGGKTYAEMSTEELQEFCQARRRDITAILEADVEESQSGTRRVSLGKKEKKSAGSEDLL